MIQTNFDCSIVTLVWGDSKFQAQETSKIAKTRLAKRKREMQELRKENQTITTKKLDKTCLESNLYLILSYLYYPKWSASFRHYWLGLRNSLTNKIITEQYSPLVWSIFYIIKHACERITIVVTYKKNCFGGLCFQ